MQTIHSGHFIAVLRKMCAMLHSSFKQPEGKKKKQARDNVNTVCDVEVLNSLEENRKTQGEVEDGHEEQKSSCPVVVESDVGGNCTRENGLCLFLK